MSSSSTSTRSAAADPLVFNSNDPAFRRNPFPTYHRLREEAPAFRVDRPPYVVLSRFADVFEAARDTATFSSARGLSFEGDEITKLGLAPTIVMMDAPDHTTFRRLVNRGFTPRRVAEIEPGVRAFVVRRIDAMLEQGSGDFISSLAGPLPTFVVASYLGVPDEDRHRFDRWTSAIVAASAAGDVLGQAQSAVIDLYGYFTELVERRRHEPADDMITDLLAADIDGAGLTMEQVLGFCFVMVAGGNDTTTGLLGGAATLLTAHLDQRQLLIEEPSCIPGAVDELLRLTSPVQGLARTTTVDVERHGMAIPAGSKVHLLYASANRDPREFGPTAERFDVQRPVPRMMTFSSGPHFCLGAAAARLQARVVLEELLTRMPDFLVDEAASVYAPGAIVRRHESLPFSVVGAGID